MQNLSFNWLTIPCVLLCFVFGPVSLAQEKPADTKTAAEEQKKEEAQDPKKEDTKTQEAKEEKKADEKKDETKKTDEKKVEDKKAEATPAPKEAKPADKKEPKKEEKKEDPKTQVRVLALSGIYKDKVEPLSLDPVTLLMGVSPGKQKPFYRLCDYMDALAKEDDVQYVVFDLSDSLSLNPAQIDEFLRRMQKLKSSNKKMIAWLENASNVQMAIAACCDEVFMTDFGGVDLPSAAMQFMYYRDAMDLVGVKASVIRAGDFKGAVEPYTNPTMSSHLKEHYLSMLKSINDARVSRIARGRGLTTSKVRELQKQRFFIANEALANGLVDRLAPYGSMKKTIDDYIGKPTEWTTPKKKKKKQMSFFDFMSVMMSGPKAKTSRTKDNTIAVLHLSGAIIDGKSNSPGNIVSGYTVSEIEKLIADDKVKGVVVRVNSPGGSATASESVRQALKKLSEKKPTVISMGEMAASGGYWISSIGVPIYAEQGTITGSIGVFSMKLSFGPLMRRIGVALEAVTLDDSAAVFAIDRPWSDGDMTTIKRSIDVVYDEFLKLVSDSRGMPQEKVKPLAGGRIWSGHQAKAAGLVDEIGGVDHCLAMIAKKAKVDDYNIIHRPTGGSGISLLDLLGESDDDAILEKFVPGVWKLLEKRGFSKVIPTLIRDSMDRTQGHPSIWLLNTAEFNIN